MTFFSALTDSDVSALNFNNEDYKAVAVENVKDALAQPFDATFFRCTPAMPRYEISRRIPCTPRMAAGRLITLEEIP